MANNPYVNKVEYAGQTIMDLTGDTATPSDVLNGVTFHDRSGTPQTGNLITHDVYDGLDSSSTSDALSAKQGSVLYTKIKRPLISLTDFNSFTVDTGEPDLRYYGNNISTMTNKPSGETNSFPFILDVSNNGGYVVQKVLVYSADGTPNLYARQQYYSNGNRPFGAWEKLTINRIDHANPGSSTYNPATNVTIHALDTLRMGNLLLVTVQFSASASITHGAKIFSMSGYGKPKINNVPISVLADNADHISHVRPAGTGTASIEFQSNGTTAVGNYYAGTIMVVLND